LQTATAVAQDATPPASQPTTQPTGSVKVTVTGDDGKPAAGVTVSVARPRGRRGGGGGGGGGGGAAAAGGGGGGRRGGRGTPIATGTTDANGVVLLSNIPVSETAYTVTARSADGSLRGRGTATVTAGDPVEVAITLAAGGAGGGGGGGGGAPPAPAPAPPGN
jgi:hypothetical protein